MMERTPLDFDGVQARLSMSPFNRWLDLRLESLDPEGVTLSCARRDEMIGSVHTGAVHGGLLGCLVDTAGSFALIARTGQTVATVDFRVNFHRPAMAGRIRAQGRVVHDGRTLGTCEVRVLDEEGRLLASGQGVFQHVSLASLASRRTGGGKPAA